MISYLQQKRGFAFRRACEELEIDPVSVLEYRRQSGRTEIALNTSISSQRDPPLAECSPLWKERANMVAKLAHSCLLLSKRGAEGLEYLRARGVLDATIEGACLGYCPAYALQNASDWGGDGGKRILLPRGIVIPWFDEHGDVICLRFRRLPTDASEDARKFYGVDEKTSQIKRYRVLQGSSSQWLYQGATLLPGRDAVLLEGEFDALIVAQEVDENAVAVVATGSTGWGRNERSIRRLASCSRVLVCFNADASGDKAAVEWLSQLGNARRWRPLWGDANEMLGDGVDLREWLAIGLTRPAGAGSNGTPSVSHSDCPQEQEAQIGSSSYEQFMEVVSRIATIFPGGCEITSVPKGAGAATGQQLPAYTPGSLPALPRTQCPFKLVTVGRDQRVKTVPCRSKTLANGWCSSHQHAQELLELGAKRGYPRVQLTQYKAIGKGKGSWEAYASRAPERWLRSDLPRIKAIAEQMQ